MDKIHSRFSTDQVGNILRSCTESLLERPAIEETLGMANSGYLLYL